MTVGDVAHHFCLAYSTNSSSAGVQDVGVNLTQNPDEPGCGKRRTPEAAPSTPT